MSSGSKKRKRGPARSNTAAPIYLHHRASEDLDFFLARVLEPADLASIRKAFAREGSTVDEQTRGPRHVLLLRRGAEKIGKVDFAFYPFDPIDRLVSWGGSGWSPSVTWR